jgi:hypothetical protein
MCDLRQLKKAAAEAEAAAINLVPSFAFIAPLLNRVYVRNADFVAAIDTHKRVLYIDSSFLDDTFKIETIVEEYLHFLLKHGSKEGFRGAKEKAEDAALAEIAIELEREYIQQRLFNRNWTYDPNLSREKQLLIYDKILEEFFGIDRKNLTLEEIFEFFKQQRQRLPEIAFVARTDLNVVDNPNALQILDQENVDISDKEVQQAIIKALQKLFTKDSSQQIILKVLKKTKVNLNNIKKILYRFASFAHKKAQTIDIFKINYKKVHSKIVYFAKKKEAKVEVSLYCIIDVSGSMQSFYSELLSITKNIAKQYDRSHFYFADTEIRSYVSAKEMCTAEEYGGIGGGGTCLDSVLLQIRERKEYKESKIKMILYVSDMESNFAEPASGERHFAYVLGDKECPPFVKKIN